MNNFSNQTYKELRENFIKIYKQVQPYFESRPLTKDQNLLTRYRTEIVETYNHYVSYIAEHFNGFSQENQDKLENQLKSDRSKLINVFKTLSIEYAFVVNIFEQINTSKIRIVILVSESTDQIDKENSCVSDSTTGTEETATGNNCQASTSSTDANSKTTDSIHSSLSDLTGEYSNNIVPRNSQNSVENLVSNTFETEERTMVQSKQEFLKLASSIINYKYNGDPLKLESFLSDIELVCDLAEEPNEDLCLKFIRAKLEAKALECMPEKIDSIDILTDALKQYIKPDTPKVVEGKLMALRLDKGNYTKFGEQLEKLSEAFRRSLISQGMTKALAQEMTISKTVEVCRKSTKSEIVKSVLAAATFDKPETVIAKFVTESDTARKEYKEAQAAKLAKSGNNSNNKNFKNSNRFNKNNQQQGQNRNNSNFNRNGQNNGYQHNNQNRNNNSNNNSNRNNNNRQGGNNNYRNNRNEHTIRVVTGDAQSNNTNNNNQNENQVFRVALN